MGVFVTKAGRVQTGCLNTGNRCGEWLMSPQTYNARIKKA
jgi:hypothetical protein